MNAQEHAGISESSRSYYGWVVVGMGFLATFVGFGLVYSFSVFFKPLASEFGWSRSTTAGAFSTYAIVHTVLAFFTGRLADKINPKLILATAGLCNGLCMVLMSFVRAPWEIYVYYGIIFSIGIACTYVPGMTIVTKWFDEKRGVAVGITAAGIGAGSMAFSPLSAWLTSAYGWRSAYLIIGVLSWLVYIPVVKFIKAPPSPSSGQGLDGAHGMTFMEAFKTLTFWAFCIVWMMIAVAMWSIIVHLVSLITDRGMSIVLAGVLVGLIGGASLFGRIGGGYVSDIIGRKKVFISTLVFILLVLGWLYISDQKWMFVVFAILFGFGTGGCAGVLPSIPADYFGHRSTGAIIGFAVAVAGIGIAVGPYMGGVIYDTTKSYDLMVIMCMAAMVLGILSATLLRPVKNPADTTD